MKNMYRAVNWMMVALWIGWISAAGAAADEPGDAVNGDADQISVYNVSPRQIDMGTITGEWQPFVFAYYSIDIAVIAGPDNIPEQDTDFFVHTDVPWITLAEIQDGTPVTVTRGKVPGTVTASLNIPETMADGEYLGHIFIMSQSDLERSVSIPVTVTVDWYEWNALTVSPSRLDLTVTEKNTSEQTFPITVMNANPDTTTYPWSAQIDVPWLSLSQTTGIGNSTVQLTVNPQQLTRVADLNDDGILDGDIGTVTFQIKMNDDQQTGDIVDEPVTLTVNLQALPSDDLSVFPEQVFWSIEREGDTVTLPGDPQYLQIFSGPAGWVASVDTHMVSLKALDRENVEGEFEHLPGYAGSGPYDTIVVTPVMEYLQVAGFGTHSGTITITDRFSGEAIQIPVSVNVRHPGEPITVNPYFSVIDTTDAEILHLELPVPDQFAYYHTASVCETAGGTWLDPDGTPGNLDEYCSLNEYAYVLVKFPEMIPDTVYAWDRYGQFAPAFINGRKLPGADALTYADGPVVSAIPVGPTRLRDYYGTMVLSVRIGADLDTAEEHKRVQVNIRKHLEGKWQVTEAYDGYFYTYDRSNLLHLYQDPVKMGYAATWGNIPVRVMQGSGPDVLYQLIFSSYGIGYIYEIQTLSGIQMSGRWQFTWPGGSSSWQDFQAERITDLP
jgi:hypothetical protein